MIATSPHLRTALLAGTALIFPALALAQPAPNARPQGGELVAGSASIGGDAGRTVINQTTDRAAINWQSFDVGRNHSVQFQQPSSTSVTLNRVVTANPSQIAGQITANGQIAIVNQSGVIFHQGSTVNAAGLVVSTANITNEAFMAGGRMNFNQPGRPDARIENHGTITVREAGLAALVAPQVANHGVIRARMGRVVLAGAETSVVDLHGDGLLSLEVTSPVRQAPANGQALVTNTGTVTATGGTVVLTAQAVDGIVQDLVRAGGRVAANTTASGQTGRVVIAGNGGNVRVEGRVSAQGRTSGTVGGDIQLLGDRTLVDSTARVNASGRAGGGTIAIGVTPNGAANRRLSARAGIVHGAVVRADATERGNGGTVLLNSSDYTVHAGTISVRGGPQGGDGGFVEVSSGKDVRVLGEVNVVAGPGGQRGTLLIDPDFLTVIVGANGTGSDDGNAADGILGFGDSSGSATISNGFINGFAGNLLLQATSTISVDAPINKPTGDLTLETRSGAITVTTNGSILLGAGDLNLIGGSFVFNGPVTVPFANAITFTGVTTGTTITQSATGILTAGNLTQTNPALFSAVSLAAADNVIAAIGTLNATSGSVTIRNTRSLTVNTGIDAGTDARIDVIGGDLTINGNVNGQTGLVVFRATGNIVQGSASTIRSPSLLISSGLDSSLTAVDPASTAGTTIAGIIQAGPAVSYFEPTGPIVMNAGRGGIVQTGGSLEAHTLSLNTTGSISLPGGASANRIDEITGLTAAGDASLVSRPGGDFDLLLSGPITVGGTLSLTHNLGGDITQGPGSIITANRLDLASDTNGVTLTNDNLVAQLGNVDIQGSLNFRNAANLTITGAVGVHNAAATIDVVGNATVTGSIVGLSGVTLRATGNIDLAAGSSVGGQNGSTLSGNTTTILAGYDRDINATDLTGSSRLTIAGSIGNSSQPPVELGAGTGGIVQTGGNILTSELLVRSGGDALLNGASSGQPNRIANLSGVEVANNFILDNGTTNLVVGPGGGGTFTARTFAIRTAGSIGIDSSITASERATFRSAALSISPGFSGLPPTVTAPLVEIAPDGARSMAINTNDAFQDYLLTPDTLSRINTSNYRFGATTFGTTTTTTASEVVFPTNFTFSGSVDARATGDIFQDSGTILNFGRLSGQAGGNIHLNEAGNLLPVIGDLSAGSEILLRTAGSQTLTGTVSAPNMSLTTGGSLTETGNGRLAGGTLTLQTGGNAILNGDNALTGLGASNVNGNFELKNTSDQLVLPVNRVFFTSGYYDIQQTGGLLVNGTITGTTGRLAASGTLQVNNHSAIARTGDLNLQSSIFTLNGLLQAAGAINITASTSASLTGTASGSALNITSPTITFGGLNAANTPVLLFLGPGGTATGTLDAGALSVFGGASATLFGSIGGITGGPAAATGRRGTSGGSLLVEPLPNQTLYLFNGCPIGVAICSPPVVEPPPPPRREEPVTQTETLFVFDPYFAPAANMPLQAAVLDPTTTMSQQLSPPAPAVSLRLYRDRSEEGELAPPNVRGEDF